MNNQSESFILFDIPEDQTIDSDRSSIIGNCSEQQEGESSRSFFQKLEHTFKKSNGKRGADVTALRGIHGSDFESYAVVCRATGTSGGWLGKMNKKNDPKERFLLIKGAFCFVFKDELSPAPKYAIRLAHTKTRVTSVTRRMTTVVMETSLGELEYEFVFSREKYAIGFAATANQMAARGETEEIQKRLGQEHLILHQSKSVRYAEKIAIEKMDDEPDKPSRISARQVAKFLRTPIAIY
mmetsp:Transcript_39552/g.95627  ORF Transcript_39552/g.95627 Transcript_39552/m.95627 type:complete len:239 (+) Transcript_39552:92-808(+)